MKNTLRNHEIQDLFEKSKSISNKYFILRYMPSKDNKQRKSVIVGKKLGNAVTRNKIRRKMKEVVYNSKDINFTMNINFVLIAKPAIVKEDFYTYKKEYENLLNKLEKGVKNEKK